MKLSIKTKNHNNTGGLERAIKSVIDQTFLDFYTRRPYYKKKIISDRKLFIKILVFDKCFNKYIEKNFGKLKTVGISDIRHILDSRECETILNGLIPPRFFSYYKQLTKIDSPLPELTSVCNKIVDTKLLTNLKIPSMFVEYKNKQKYVNSNIYINPQ